MKIDIKKLLQCRVALFLLLGWAVFSVVGYAKKDSVYKNYSVDAKTTPYFVLVLQGVKDGLYPWSSEPLDFWQEWEQLVEGVQEPGGFWVSSADEFHDVPDGMDQNPANDTDKIQNSLSGDQGTGADGENYGNISQNPAVGMDKESFENDDAGLQGIMNEGDVVKKNQASENMGTATENITVESGEAVTDDVALQFISVDETYFDDAVFIGDSRTVGLRDYSGLEKPTFYATVGMNIYDMWTEPFCEADGENITLEEALGQKQFKKIYFQIGINEMGRGTLESFMVAYYQTVEKFKQLQPDAIIYVQGIMRVAKEKSDTDPIFNNPAINLRNEQIARLADNQKVFYIDVNEAVCDEEGHLRADLTFDSLHLLGSKYGIWVEFLKTKGILSE